MFHVSEINKQFQDKVPFISLVCWGNKYQQYIDQLLGYETQATRKAGPTIKPFRLVQTSNKNTVTVNENAASKQSYNFVDQDVANMKLFPGTVFKNSNKNVMNFVAKSPTSNMTKTMMMTAMTSQARRNNSFCIKDLQPLYFLLNSNNIFALFGLSFTLMKTEVNNSSCCLIFSLFSFTISAVTRPITFKNSSSTASCLC
jgi:hypothetical protein